MVASSSGKCFVSRQLLYFEEMEFFPLCMETIYIEKSEGMAKFH